MSALAVLWFFLIFVLIAGYFVLDGFDLGVGVLYRALAKDERERALVRRSIGPVWDGNEVWLLTAGGALFAAVPAAYRVSCHPPPPRRTRARPPDAATTDREGGRRQFGCRRGREWRPL